MPTFVIRCLRSLLFKVRGSGTWCEANETVLCGQSLPHRGSWAELWEEPLLCQFAYTAVPEWHSNHTRYLHKTLDTQFLLLAYLPDKQKFPQLVTEFTKLETGQCSPWRTPDHAFNKFYVLAQKMCVNVIIEINAVVELAAVLIFIRKILVSEFDWQTCYPAVFAVPALKARSVRWTSQHVKTAAFSILSDLLRVFTNCPTIHIL